MYLSQLELGQDSKENTNYPLKYKVAYKCCFTEFLSKVRISETHRKDTIPGQILPLRSISEPPLSNKENLLSGYYKSES